VLDQPIQGGGSSTRSVPGQDFANGNQGFDNGNQGFDNGNQGFDNNTFFDQNPNQGAGFDSGPVVQDFGTFGSVSAATRYLYLDALVWTRGDGDITNSNFGSLNDFDFTGGFRATYGVRNDSTSGTEIGFLALPEVDQEISLTDPLVESPTGPTTGADLTVGFIPVGFGAPADAFTSATAQTQRKESDLYGLEFNRVNWGWDLIKTYTGVRYLKFDDSYNVTSSGVTPLLGPTGTPIVDGFGNTQFDTVDGDFTLDASNSLFGAHIGGELFYDTGYRWSASGIAKYGLFANFNDFDTNFNNGDFNASSESDNFTISSVLELGILAHYQLRTNIRFRTGYQALVISNVATVSDNIGIAPGQFTGVNATDSDDVVFHGFNFGLEFYR